MILLLVGIHLCLFCDSSEVKVKIIILMFTSFHQNLNKGRGGYHLIVVSLVSTSDALLDGVCLLCQKVFDFY